MNPKPARLDRPLGLILLIAFAVPMVFALFTNHVWEDYYITFRASKNLAEGHGLVFQIGERLHTFTSPLGVLLPALFSWITKSDTASLWLFRIVSCAALSSTVGLLWHTLQEHKVGTVTRWITISLLLTNSSTIDFTVNGMETALLLFFGMWSLRELGRPEPMRSFRLGIALAGLMWTRPDAFVPGGALVLGVLLFVRSAGSRFDRATLLGLVKACGWAALIYGPWVAWAWWYYGSPIPHTIIAKAGNAPGVHLPGYLLEVPLKFLSGGSVMTWLFSPSYFVFGGWPAQLIQLSTILSTAAGFLWIFPSVHRLGRAASFAVLIGSFYLQAIPIFPWYTPIWHLLATIALGCGAEAWLRALPAMNWSHRLLRTGLVIVVLTQLATLGLCAWQVRHQQQIIEEQGRKQIGLWLKANAKPTDSVMLECLGYIGYFSQLKMFDYPGLSSREVVEGRQKFDLSFNTIPDHFKVTWLVLRRGEYWPLKADGSLKNYEIAAAWDARPHLDAVTFLPGRELLAYDSIFIVLRRKPDEPVSTPAIDKN